MEFVYTLNETPDIARKLFRQVAPENVFAIYGEMGAGKTTFVSAACKVLDVTDAVSSPTYTIINEYVTQSGSTIYHIDLYRLKDEEEVMQAGVEDVLNSGSTCFIEWPQMAENMFQKKVITLHFEVLDEQTRRLSVAEK